MNMRYFQIDQLTSDVEESPPCGPDLRNSAEQYRRAFEIFEQMEQAARPTASRLKVNFANSGESAPYELLPDVPPQWGEAANKALSLLLGDQGKSKKWPATRDLRVAGTLVSAVLAQQILFTDRMHVAAEGLKLVSKLLEKFWNNLHPQRAFRLRLGDEALLPDEIMGAILSAFQAESILKDLSSSPIQSETGEMLGTFGSMKDKLEDSASPLARAVVLALTTAGVTEEMLAELNGVLDGLRSVVRSKLTVTLQDAMPQTKIEESDLKFDDVWPQLEETRAAVDRLIESLSHNKHKAFANASNQVNAEHRPSNLAEHKQDLNLQRSTHLLPMTPNSIEDVYDILMVLYDYLKSKHGSNMARIFIGRAAKIVLLPYEQAIENVFPDMKSVSDKLEAGGK